MELLYDSTDPRFAADFANTLAQEFIDSNMEARWKMSQHTGEWLSRQLEDMRIKLERSEDALQSYARRTGLMFTSEGSNSEKTNIAEDKLRQLQEELSKAQGDRITKQARWEMTKTSPAEGLPDVLNDSSLRALQDKVTELRRQRAELITIYTEKHSKVKRVEAQIAAARSRPPKGARADRRSAPQRLRSRAAPRETARHRLCEPVATGHRSGGEIHPVQHPEARAGFQPPALRSHAAARQRVEHCLCHARQQRPHRRSG